MLTFFSNIPPFEISQPQNWRNENKKPNKDSDLKQRGEDIDGWDDGCYCTYLKPEVAGIDGQVL